MEIYPMINPGYDTTCFWYIREQRAGIGRREAFKHVQSLFFIRIFIVLLHNRQKLLLKSHSSLSGN